MSLYHLCSNSLIRPYNDHACGILHYPVWIDGIGMCGYYYDDGNNDYFYGVATYDGRVFKINETLSALEPKTLIYDELRESALVEAYSTLNWLEYDAINGIYLVSSWATDDYAEHYNLYISMRGKTHLWGMSWDGYVVRTELNVRESLTGWEDPRRKAMVRGPEVMWNLFSRYNFSPRKDGNYYVCCYAAGAIQAYNPVRNVFFGPIYRVPTTNDVGKTIGHMAFSRDLGIFVIFYGGNSLTDSSISAFAPETVPYAISDPVTSDGEDIRGGEPKELQVTVTGDLDEGVENERVSWSIGAGSGTLLHQQTVTDENGVATNIYYPPIDPVPYDVTINVSVST